MVEVWTERKLVDLGLGLIDIVAAGGDRSDPAVKEITVTYSALHLAALRAVAKALREAGVPPMKEPQQSLASTPRG